MARIRMRGHFLYSLIWHVARYSRGRISRAARKPAGPCVTGLLAAFLLIAGCGTPAEVKTLSTAQLGYFDSVIAAVRIQSDALLLAAEAVKQPAEAEIERQLQTVRERTPRTLAALDPNLPEGQRVDQARQLLNSAVETEQTATEAKAHLQTTLDAIRTKTQELQIALQQMKEVQRALDAYLQSEQVGERVTSQILGYPGVQDLLTRATTVMSTVSSRTSDLSQLVSQLRPTR